MIPPDVVWPASALDDAAARVSGAARLGGQVDRRAVSVAYPRLGHALRTGPAVVRVPGGLLAVARAGRRRATIVTPAGERRRVSVDDVIHAVAAPVEGPIAGELDGLDARMQRALRMVRLADVRVDVGWHLRPSPGASVRQVLRTARLGRWLAVVVVSHLAVYGVFLAVWAVVAGAAARGELDGGVVLTGVLLLLALVPLRAAATWSAGVVSIEAGALLKRRLLGGVLRLDPDDMRHQGAGQLLGTALEAEAIETLALTGAYGAFLAVAELLVATVALVAGFRSAALLALLVGWCVFAAAVARTYLERRRAWTGERLELTHDLVERIVGHRTRLAQEGPGILDTAADDVRLEGYERRARAMDRVAVVLDAVVPRAWLVAALAVVVFPSPQGEDPVAVATAVGGALLAFHGLEKLTRGLVQLADAAVAWEHIAPVARAATGVAPVSAPTGATAGVEARAASFAFGERTVLDRVSLAVRPGDRVLLQGASGSGKSTLAALLSGVRLPTAGTVAGTDAVTSAPQFHENHVLSGSLAFNLLLGRSGTAEPEDLAAAAELCHELGLGDLLAAMPAGIEQSVGEVGWQLSHGERSRVYVARALLCEADVVVLDESFAALDPEALRLTLECVLRRAPALVVIAHE